MTFLLLYRERLIDYTLFCFILYQYSSTGKSRRKCCQIVIVGYASCLGYSSIV